MQTLKRLSQQIKNTESIEKKKKFQGYQVYIIMFIVKKLYKIIIFRKIMSYLQASP